MEPKPITSKEFTPIVRRLMRMVALSIIESSAVQVAITVHFGDAAFHQQIEIARAAVRETWKPVLDNLEQSTPESFDDILQNFEGLVQ